MKIIQGQIVRLIIWGLCCLPVAEASAALVVRFNFPDVVGSKVIAKLELQNTYSEKIEAVRAAVFLLDDQGKVVGHSTSWIIGGGKDKPSLGSNAETTYNFLINTYKPFSKTKLMVERILLENGKLGNALKDVQITYATK